MSNTLTTTTNKTTTPRTVKAVLNINSKLERYDTLYEKALSKGNLGLATYYEQELYELDSLVASVSDALWNKATQHMAIRGDV